MLHLAAHDLAGRMRGFNCDIQNRMSHGREIICKREGGTG
jgi:hypothetical protein